MTPSMRGGDMAMTDSRRLIWAFPVYSWGVPPYVLDIIRSVVIDAPAAMPHHAVMTCGDDCGPGRSHVAQGYSRSRMEGAVCDVGADA